MNNIYGKKNIYRVVISYTDILSDWSITKFLGDKLRNRAKEEEMVQEKKKLLQ